MTRATARLLQSHRPGDGPLRVLAASGQLGYGIPADALARGMARRPHFIGADMGSIDPGPYYLGSGAMAAPAAMVRRDLALVLRAALDAGIPLIIGSAGTAGAQPQLARVTAMLREVAQDLGRSFRLATIASDVQPQIVLEALREGRLAPIGPMPAPSEDAILACSHIVGQCGTETFARALATDPDVVLAGRACDTAIFAALPQLLGYDFALALHMAKIIECTSLCCTPGGRDAMLATLSSDGFVLESMNPALRATPASVAAHALYEQADPHSVREPEGTLLLRDARYEALDERRTRVHGARFEPMDKPTLKVEAAAAVGERVVLIAGATDSTLLKVLPQVLNDVEQKVRALVPGAWSRYAHIYGQGAVRPLPAHLQTAHEVGLVIEFIAPDQDTALAAASVYKQNLLHHGYPGRVSTAGNIAFAFTPSELRANTAYKFVLYHELMGERLGEMFKVEMQEIDGSIR